MAREEEPKQTEEGPGNHADDVRESIWSIRVKHKRLYFRLFTLQIIIGAAWLIRRAILDESLAGIPDRILSVWQELAPVAIASAVIALAITDTWGTITVFADWLEDELKKRRQRQIKAAVDAAVKVAVEETRAEERETARQFRRNLRDWNRRREAAASAGEEFHEPPPGIDLENEDPQREC